MRLLSICLLIGSVLWLPSRALNAYIPTYSAVLLGIQSVPNPNPAGVALHLDRVADQVRLRIYSGGGILILESVGGAAPDGWSMVSLPAEVANLPNGTYYVRGSVRGSDADWCEPRTCAMVILR